MVMWNSLNSPLFMYFCLQESPVTSTAEVSTMSVDNGKIQFSEAYEDISIKPPQPHPATGESHYTDLGSCPSDAPPILPQLDGVKCMEINKHTVEYAELGARPANAPVILPPETSIQYMDVRPTAKDTVSINSLFIPKVLYLYMCMAVSTIWCNLFL